MYAHETSATDQLLREFFQEKGRLLKYARGEVIVHAHDELQGVHYIANGCVKAYGIDDRGEQYVHIVYKAGELFPLVRLVDPTPAYSFYSAFTDCQVYRVSQNSILEALDNNLGVTKALLEKAVLQFRLYANRIDNLQYKFARERLIYRLLFLASRFGRRNEDGSYTIMAPFTQQIIGDSINLSRESVSREFDRLRSMDLIAYEDHAIVLKDWHRLGAEFHEPPSTDWWGLQ